MSKEPLIIIGGPTACGKSAVSVALAKRLGTSIISADSVQVYRHMDIGSAKVTPEQMQDIRHFLIDVKEPDDLFDVTEFVRLAKIAVLKCRQAGSVPIIVGGTAFYVQALIKDIDFETEKPDEAYRAKLSKLARAKGTIELKRLLFEADPVSARSIDVNNEKRLIRALEFYKNNGYPISEHNKRMRAKPAAYDYVYFILSSDRKWIYQRINERVDAMIKEGLVDEVKGLRRMGYSPKLRSMRSLGYAQINDHLDGKYDLDEAVRLIKRDTRHFAKRQLTWYRNENTAFGLSAIEVDIGRFDADADRIAEYMENICHKKGLL